MDDKKIIINVGRQLGSGGLVIAKRLAEDFGCNFYDRELLNLAAKESGKKVYPSFTGNAYSWSKNEYSISCECVKSSNISKWAVLYNVY